MTVARPARALLPAERTALNLIGHLSGIPDVLTHCAPSLDVAHDIEM